MCGGGIVPGSIILIGGSPGIGKSTLLLQVLASMAQRGMACAYVSGEESIDQVRLRAQRLGVGDCDMELGAATDAGAIAALMAAENSPKLMVIDSIQTMMMEGVDSAPGSVSQVRACTHELVKAAKAAGVALILVGHVTKEGNIAGPQLLAHLVDAVFEFEGGDQFRILRTTKNRFGATDEIGVFRMTEGGLREVPNPSELFLTDSRGTVDGCAVYAGMEGTRPLLVEVQALVTPAPYGTPRRTVVGWDTGRLAMIIAVLEARCGLALGQNDVYLSVAGGIRVNEPGADLAVAAALMSALCRTPVPGDAVFVGEVGLSGEIRPVSWTDARMREADRLGFATAFTPRRTSEEPLRPMKLRATEIKRLVDLVPLFHTDAAPRAA